MLMVKDLRQDLEKGNRVEKMLEDAKKPQLLENFIVSSIFNPITTGTSIRNTSSSNTLQQSPPFWGILGALQGSLATTI